VLLTATAIVVGEYLLVSYYLAVESGLSAADGLLVAPIADVTTTLPDMIVEAPLRPVLWLIALGTAFMIPWRKMVGD
jgi:hypothetical protein